MPWVALLTACWGLSAGDLDELIVAHQQYIDTMLRKALLDDASELNTVSSPTVRRTADSASSQDFSSA